MQTCRFIPNTHLRSPASGVETGEVNEILTRPGPHFLLLKPQFETPSRVTYLYTGVPLYLPRPAFSKTSPFANRGDGG